MINGIGRSMRDGVSRLPISPQYRRGCDTRMPVPLTSRPITLSTLIQCVIRTSAIWRKADVVSTATLTRASLIMIYPPEISAIIGQKKNHSNTKAGDEKESQCLVNRETVDWKRTSHEKKFTCTDTDITSTESHVVFQAAGVGF